MAYLKNKILELWGYLMAWWHDVPFEVEDFWQPGYTTFGDGTYKGWSLLPFDERSAGVGDVAGLLKDSDKVHCYEITRRSRSGGSDHIASPYNYDLRYKATISRSEYDEAA